MIFFVHPSSARLAAFLAPMMCIFSWSQSQADGVKTPASTAIPVRIAAATGMLRDGKPYFVKGAGGDKNLKELTARGANSLRTWSTNGLGGILDEAQTLGLTVSAGIWLENECSWFSYSNPEHCAKQAERVRKEVLLYRNHPALLAWGIGNEVEGDGSNISFWKQLDSLAVLVRELDPAHPTYTALAGANEQKVKGLMKHVPHLDFLGINTYGGVFGVRQHLEKVGWTRPWLLTEWGPRGFWESKKSASNAPLEQTSTEKADMMRSAYIKAISPTGGCLGSYVFVWGWKFEATATWFGIFTHGGETTAVADTMQEMWSGKAPSDRAPVIGQLEGVPKQPIAPATRFEASAKATDADPLTWHWLVLPEKADRSSNSNKTMPDSVDETIVDSKGHSVTIQAPRKPGAYRLYVWVKDGHGHAATANMPFVVNEPSPR
ncbi:MAG: glycoside hydrolase family 2 TIM barrel-domain containing protein [Verrucomicrobiota bacterium]